MFNFELSVKILLSVFHFCQIEKRKTDQLFNQALNKVLADLQNQNYEIIDVQLSAGLTAWWEATARYLILYK